MRVFGSLDIAGLESLATDPIANLFNGRVYYNSVSGAVRVCSGGVWNTFGSTGGIGYVTKTTTYTAANGDLILANTSGGAFTITMPAAPASGAVVEFFDAADTWDTNNLTIAMNGENVHGAAGSLTLDVKGAHVKLVYIDATNGWKAY